jgi:hypothetical protein
MTPLPRCKFGPLGRLPVDKDRLHSLPRLATFMSIELPPTPSVFNYANGISSWGMMLNDQIGCCEVAAAGHYRMTATYAAKGEPVAIPDSDILAAYVALTGYDPSTGANDTGVATLDLLDYWMNTGIGGNKIAGYFAVDPTNHSEVMQAIYLFGGVLAGINLPKSAEDQFDAGQPWTPEFWSPILGGHMTLRNTFGPSGTNAITWDKVQPVTWAFDDRYCDEMYIVVDDDFFESSGKTPRGLDKPGMFAAGQQLRAA